MFTMNSMSTASSIIFIIALAWCTCLLLVMLTLKVIAKVKAKKEIKKIQKNDEKRTTVSK